VRVCTEEEAIPSQDISLPMYRKMVMKIALMRLKLKTTDLMGCNGNHRLLIKRRLEIRENNSS